MILLIPVLGGTCLVLIAVVLVIVLVVRRAVGPQTEHNPGMPLEVTRAALTAATATPLPEGPPQETCTVSVNSGEAQQPVPLPVSLTIESRVFPVVATLPSGGQWSFPDGYPGAAAWVCGSVVNYLLQLEETPDNQALLESVQPGSSLTLRLSNGTDLRFRVGERRQVNAYDPSALAQARPSLTVILPEAADTWQIVVAEYAAEAEAAGAPVNALAQPNQPVQVGDVRVTVTQGPNRIAFFGCNTVDNPYDWATDTLPGVYTCRLADSRYLDAERLAQMGARIRQLREQGYAISITLQYYETEEFAPYPQQVLDFRTFADLGADVVQGSQAHQPQTLEFYGETFIHYGLGNLFFDQNWAEVRPSFIDRLVFYDGRLLSVDLRPTMMEEYGRRRPMTAAERAEFLGMLFALRPEGE